MSIRQIKYTVTAEGIEPSVKQFGGRQREHDGTEIVFEISSGLYQLLQEQAEAVGGQLMYRIIGYDGQGGYANTVPKELPKEDDEEMTLSTVIYTLEEWITRYGGIVKAVLVISLIKDDNTEMELFYPAIIQLQNLPSGQSTSGKNFQSPVTLEKVIQEAVAAAYSVREDADNGLFKGDKGDKGEKGDKGDKGDTYVLTDNDRSVIAAMVMTNEFTNYVNNDLDEILSTQEAILGGESNE